MLTDRQRFVYFKAHRAACMSLGLFGKDCEDYRRQVMREECGVNSMNDMNRTSDFDAVVGRFWADAGDLSPRVRYRTSPYRREAVDKGYYDALDFKVNIS